MKDNSIWDVYSFWTLIKTVKLKGVTKFPLADELVFSEKNFVSIKPLKRNTMG
jgi:hypothetical protein